MSRAAARRLRVRLARGRTSTGMDRSAPVESRRAMLSPPITGSLLELAASCGEAYTVPLMSFAAEASDLSFPHRHLLEIEGLSPAEITALLDLSEQAAKLSRQIDKKRDDLRGRTLINLFFEASTRTQSSFELAG